MRRQITHSWVDLGALREKRKEREDEEQEKSKVMQKMTITSDEDSDDESALFLFYALADILSSFLFSSMHTVVKYLFRRFFGISFVLLVFSISISVFG